MGTAIDQHATVFGVRLAEDTAAYKKFQPYIDAIEYDYQLADKMDGNLELADLKWVTTYEGPSGQPYLADFSIHLLKTQGPACFLGSIDDSKKDEEIKAFFKFLHGLDNRVPVYNSNPFGSSGLVTRVSPPQTDTKETKIKKLIHEFEIELSLARPDLDTQQLRLVMQLTEKMFITYDFSTPRLESLLSEIQTNGFQESRLREAREQYFYTMPTYPDTSAILYDSMTESLSPDLIAKIEESGAVDLTNDLLSYILYWPEIAPYLRDT